MLQTTVAPYLLFLRVHIHILLYQNQIFFSFTHNNPGPKLVKGHPESNKRLPKNKY